MKKQSAKVKPKKNVKTKGPKKTAMKTAIAMAVNKKVAKQNRTQPIYVGDMREAPLGQSETSFVGKDLAGLGFAIGSVVAVNILGAIPAYAQSSGVCTGGATGFCSVCSVCVT